MGRSTSSIPRCEDERLVALLDDARSVDIEVEFADSPRSLRERGLLTKNPITGLSRRAPRTVQAIDRRVVVNPVQARALLDAVHAEKPSGALLVAFFGAMYYSALRPGEAATLRKSNLALPAEGWVSLVLEASTPEAGASWTDSVDGARNAS